MESLMANRVNIIFFLLIAGLHAAPVLAGAIEVFQCEDEHGRMALSDRPCKQLDPTFEFVDMRSVETYGPARGGAPGSVDKQPAAPKPRVKGSRTLPPPDPDCEPQDDDDPWLNRVGKDDCKPAS